VSRASCQRPCSAASLLLGTVPKAPALPMPISVDGFLGGKRVRGSPRTPLLGEGSTGYPRLGNRGPQASWAGTEKCGPMPGRIFWLIPRRASSTILRRGKYKLLKRQMRDFARQRGLHFLDEFDLASVSGFRSEWAQGSTHKPGNGILPDFVLRASEETPRATDRDFFWSGKDKLDSIVRSWQTAASPL
jgi:hypothetical protein